jgi:predicted metal-dependent enzyme (double-stranded beta helix superfamily)
MLRAGFQAGRREVLKRSHRQGASRVLKRTSSILEHRGPDGTHASQGTGGEGSHRASWLIGHTRLSPQTVISVTEESLDTRNNDPISLVELIDALPPLLRLIKKNATRHMHLNATQDEARGTSSFDPVTDLFGRLDLSCGWWNRYAHSDPTKNYSRNLIASDNETFTLLMLVWNPGKASPIHDHPCDGCWVRVCEGKIQEARYEIDAETDKLEMISDAVIEDSAPTFMNNYIGYHKVGNPSDTQPAVTLHLYCPPVQKCTIWLDPTDASRPSTAIMCNYTEYGVRITDPP